MKRLVTAFVVFAAAAWLVAPAAGQTPKESELKAEVPELTAMHDIISPMWHDAWPKKDTAALAALAPKFEKQMDAVKKAKLPGILREKATPWEAGVVKLGRSVAAYKLAADAKNDEALLKAAEQLHTDYETLVKVVRPILKEMDDFHSSLYVLYHYQLEVADAAGALETINAMKPKMEALNAVVLPERHKAKQDAFVAQRARLSKAFDNVVAATVPGAGSRIKEVIELMHVEYEKLEKVF